MGLRRKKRFTNPWPKKETHNHGGGGWVRKKKIPGFTDPWPKKKETNTIMEGHVRKKKRVTCDPWSHAEKANPEVLVLLYSNCVW
jgi:hypothetical protein